MLAPSLVDEATIATFELGEDCRIVDLRELSPVPSSISTTERRRELGFLDGFRRDVSGPVTRDGHEHIDYVPTQVVAEYLRYVFKDGAGEEMQGVSWGSSKLPGTRNIVLFMDASRCVEAGESGEGFSDPLIELVGRDPPRAV